MAQATTSITLHIGTSGAVAADINTKIGEITSIDTFDGANTIIDVSNLDDNYRKRITALRDYGNINIQLHFADEDGQNELIAAKSDGVARAFKLTYPASVNDVYTFEGLVSTFSQSAAVDGVIMGTAQVSITGNISRTDN